MSGIAVSYSERDRLGKRGDLLAWPQPFSNQPGCRLDRTGRREERTAEKFYFTGELPEGKASVYDPLKQEGITFTFPKEKVPYLSVWANYGGYQGQYHLALEPATGFLDDLAHAMKRDAAAAVVEGGGKYGWHLEVSWMEAKR
ncbi:aldose 1-epimerase family protein [Paenibacillus sp. AR247]|uniref:aldose 1-epimerase family protein n=1 Tax=Paenibacillus sp. AR247 TaxID=1631599 RepID=UPI0021579105|nr:aldose 1-epimerase family protein [Paenibacillus sp. AR247]